MNKIELFKYAVGICRPVKSHRRDKTVPSRDYLSASRSNHCKRDRLKYPSVPVGPGLAMDRPLSPPRRKPGSMKRRNHRSTDNSSDEEPFDRYKWSESDFTKGMSKSKMSLYNSLVGAGLSRSVAREVTLQNVKGGKRLVLSRTGRDWTELSEPPKGTECSSYSTEKSDTTWSTAVVKIDEDSDGSSAGTSSDSPRSSPQKLVQQFPGENENGMGRKRRRAYRALVHAGLNCQDARDIVWDGVKGVVRIDTSVVQGTHHSKEIKRFTPSEEPDPSNYSKGAENVEDVTRPDCERRSNRDMKRVRYEPYKIVTRRKDMERYRSFLDTKEIKGDYNTEVAGDIVDRTRPAGERRSDRKIKSDRYEPNKVETSRRNMEIYRCLLDVGLSCEDARDIVFKRISGPVTLLRPQTISKEEVRIAAKSVQCPDFNYPRVNSMSCFSDTYSSHIISDGGRASGFNCSKLEITNIQSTKIMVSNSTTTNSCHNHTLPPSLSTFSERGENGEPVSKRPRLEPPVEQSHTRPSYPRVLLQAKNSPSESLTTEQLDLLEDSILNEVTLGARHDINFEGLELKSGKIIVTCGDNYTANWLYSRGSRLKTWKGPELVVLDEEMAQSSCKVTVFLPCTTGQEWSRTCALFSAQNSGIHVDLWKLLSTHDQDGGQLLVILIDPASRKQIVKLGGRLNYRFGKVWFRELGQSGNAEIM